VNDGVPLQVNKYKNKVQAYKQVEETNVELKKQQAGNSHFLNQATGARAIV
jgi:hypothetical protein